MAAKATALLPTEPETLLLREHSPALCSWGFCGCLVVGVFRVLCSSFLWCLGFFGLSYLCIVSVVLKLKPWDKPAFPESVWIICGGVTEE